MKLILVRHGQTDQNKYDTNGNPGNDFALNDIGYKEIEYAAKLIMKYNPNVIYSSPKRRATESASIISRSCNALDLKKNKLIDEYDMGDWSGLSSQELIHKIEDDEGWTNGRPTREWKAPKGESWSDLEYRANKFLELLKNRYKDNDSIVVVSHNQMIRALRGVALNTNFEEWFDYKPKNAEVLVIDI